jgi:hypothetical protein
MTTSTDMLNQVEQTLGGVEYAFDIPGIVEDIQQEHGTVDIDDVPAARYWAIVEKHEIV